MALKEKLGIHLDQIKQLIYGVGIEYDI